MFQINSALQLNQVSLGFTLSLRPGAPRAAPISRRAVAAEVCGRGAGGCSSDTGNCLEASFACEDSELLCWWPYTSAEWLCWHQEYILTCDGTVGRDDKGVLPHLTECSDFESPALCSRERLASGGWVCKNCQCCGVIHKSAHHCFSSFVGQNHPLSLWSRALQQREASCEHRLERVPAGVHSPLRSKYDCRHGFIDKAEV